MKVLVNTPLSTFSGYGRDGIGLVRSLERIGLDVYVRPRVVQAPLPQEVANLFTKELRAPFDLSITHVDPMLMELLPDTEAACKFNVAWSMWEWPNVSKMRGRSSLKKRLNRFNAVVAYDEVSREAFTPHCSVPLLKQQGGSEFEDWEYVERDWDEDFYFGMVGAPLSLRKNPFVAIHSYAELSKEDPTFAKHARLMLKTSADDRALSPRIQDVYPGIRIFADQWDRDTLREFYKNVHVLLAPSRGEGKHLPSLEFQATGGPVIATNWGGMAEWLDPEFSYPLNDFSLEPMDIYHKGSPSAEVSKEELKRNMLHAFYNRESARDKGKLASELIPQRCSWDAVVANLFEKLRVVEDGEEVYQKYLEARNGRN